MLHEGLALSLVVGSFCGHDSAGRAAQAAWLQFLSRLPTLHSRRAVLEHFLRTFNGAKKHGAQWRVVDASGFVGRRHVQRPRSVVDPESGEVLDAGELERVHCPSGEAGGLAALQGRSPRQLDRYRHWLRLVGILGSAQPRADAPDAVRPRSGDGRWAYAQHWLRMPPTPEMLRRWGARGGFGAETYADKGRGPRGPFSAAQPPRADDLRELAAHADADEQLWSKMRELGHTLG